MSEDSLCPRAPAFGKYSIARTEGVEVTSMMTLSKETQITAFPRTSTTLRVIQGNGV
jgi:hypothetical protein